MNIQTLSVVVPNKVCINNCPFCVSRMHTEDYPNLLEDKFQFLDLYEKQYLDRLRFARDNGCNTVILTGNSEPQQNKQFLKWFGLLNRMVLEKPFRCVELQTTGVLLDDAYLRFLRNVVTVTTISLSMSSLRSDKENWDIISPKVPFHSPMDFLDLVKSIKRYDFTLRLSLNLTDCFTNYEPKNLFQTCRDVFLADQVTLRVMYTSGQGTPQDRWIERHAFDPQLLERYQTYIRTHGRALEILPFGATRYDVDGVSVVLDNMCMSQEAREALKYVILRPDCKLYSKWDSKASLIF